ncbi:MAG: helix-turn-helix domain-containing protein [Clostridia bacterium]|nr:helix-turn-helix domain-containing protein [Clostridia bacterium]
MDIGKKIKTLRNAKMMTQSELAGSEITRNMLSRIENGSALPSLPTLLYLSERLGVPAGLLLADNKEEFMYRKMTGMPDIRSAFAAGDWEICLDLCDSLGGNDDETEYIRKICFFNSAKDAFNSGNLRLAGSLFSDLCRDRLENDDPYQLRLIKKTGTVYLAYMREVSPSFDSDDAAYSVPPDTLSDPFCRYSSVFISMNSRGTEAETQSLISPAAYSESTDENNILLAKHIKARLLMEKNDFSAAHQILKKMLSDTVSLPAPVMYFVFSDLEKCCSAISDYKGAYEYSGAKLDMMERFFR